MSQEHCKAAMKETQESQICVFELGFLHELFLPRPWKQQNPGSQDLLSFSWKVYREGVAEQLHTGSYRLDEIEEGKQRPFNIHSYIFMRTEQIGRVMRRWILGYNIGSFRQRKGRTHSPLSHFINGLHYFPLCSLLWIRDNCLYVAVELTPTVFSLPALNAQAWCLFVYGSRLRAILRATTSFLTESFRLFLTVHCCVLKSPVMQLCGATQPLPERMRQSG